MEPAQAAIKTANTAKLEAVIEHVKLSAERYRQGFLAGCDAARVVDELIRDMGFGQGLRVFVRMWETTSAEALNTEMWWDWYTAECETRGLLGGATLWSHSTLNGWLQIVRFMDAHADEDDQDGQAVRGATSQEEALKAIRKYNQQQKEVRSKQAAEQRSSLGKRDRTRKGPTLMEEQAASVAPKRPRRRKPAASGGGRAGPSRSSGDDDAGGSGGDGDGGRGKGTNHSSGRDGGGDGGGRGANRSSGGDDGSGEDESMVAHRLPRGDYTQPRYAAVMTFIHLLYGRAPAYINEVAAAYEGAKGEKEELRFVGAIERALRSEKTGEVRRDLKEQWHLVWRNAKGLHGADSADGGGGADGGASGSGSAGASAEPATQLTELQEAELLEAFEALPPRVNGAMKGKGRHGDWRALALDVFRAITELEKEQMPPPPPRSSTPVVPTSPPAASAPARRSARHTPATSSSSAASSSSSAPSPVSRRSPRLASSRPAAATARVVIKPPLKCKCGRPKVRLVDFIEHESFRGTYDWYIEHQDELPQNDWTDDLRGWLGDTDRVFPTCSCEKCHNVVDVCDTFIKLEIYQADSDRLDDEFGVLCVSLKASVIAKHLDWLDANVEKLKQAWWYPDMAVILEYVLTDVEEIKEKRAAPEESIATCVDIDAFRWSKLNRYLQIVDRQIAASTKA